jgi:DNA-3-methyladenine glycosylase
MSPQWVGVISPVTKSGVKQIMRVFTPADRRLDIRLRKIYGGGMHWAPLPAGFYEGSAKEVAPGLLGHWLIRRTPAGDVGGRIVEVEAYLEGDPACHAFRGKTPRNAVMWGPPGRAYVYFVYGMHFCVNAVCLPAGRAEAVLIRAIEPELNVGVMKRSRESKLGESQLTNGPAKLCQALDIGRTLDGANLTSLSSELLIARNLERNQFVTERGPSRSSGRIGLSVAEDWPLRFFLAGSAHLSRKEKRR